jgi:hypothetical protein
MVTVAVKVEVEVVVWATTDMTLAASMKMEEASILMVGWTGVLFFKSRNRCGRRNQGMDDGAWLGQGIVSQMLRLFFVFEMVLVRDIVVCCSRL